MKWYSARAPSRLIAHPAGFQPEASATDQLQGHPMVAFVQRHVHSDDAGQLIAKLQRLLDTAGCEQSVEFRLRRPDGAWRDVEGLGRNLLELLREACAQSLQLLLPPRELGRRHGRHAIGLLAGV